MSELRSNKTRAKAPKLSEFSQAKDTLVIQSDIEHAKKMVLLDLQPKRSLEAHENGRDRLVNASATRRDQELIILPAVLPTDLPKFVNTLVHTGVLRLQHVLYAKFFTIDSQLYGSLDENYILFFCVFVLEQFE